LIKGAVKMLIMIYRNQTHTFYCTGCPVLFL